MTQSISARTSEPAWEIARLFPDQGFWSEEEYLELEGESYVEHGVFARGETASSALLMGLEVALDEVWAAARV